MKRKGDLIFGIVLVSIIVLFFAGLYIYKDKFSEDDGGSEFTVDTVYDLKIENEPMLGNPEAPITIVEFGDYKCPACGFFGTQIMAALEADYIDKGLVNVVFKNYPFLGVDSTRAAIYTEGVYEQLGNEAFWTMNKKIFEYQSDLYANDSSASSSKDLFSEDLLNELAQENLSAEDYEKVKDVLDNDQNKLRVESDLREVNEANVTGTPSVFVNGKKVYDSMNYEFVVGAIEEELEKLKAEENIDGESND